MNKLKPSFFPIIVWMVLSTILLTLPGSSLPDESWLGKIWFDKWVHVGMFAIMVTSGCWAWLKKPSTPDQLKKDFIKVALLGLAYGIIMEFIQRYFIPGRSFDAGDIIADGIGCVVGAIFSGRRFIKK